MKQKKIQGRTTQNETYRENGNCIKKERIAEYEELISEFLNKANMVQNLDEYGQPISRTIKSYNNTSNNTMMVKMLRKVDDRTKNRDSHQRNVVNIAAKIANGINHELGYIAINPRIVSIMARNHDIGHTFLGHSGEWWISNVKEDYGIGYYCHNALGARDLIYNQDIYQKIIDEIKQSNPDISDKKLSRIREDLWIIMEGINSHNGERSESKYTADFKKIEKDFEQEILHCHTQKGFDKKIIPGTIEATLMRLCDKISYIPYDMVDGIREGFISELNEEYVETLERLGVTKDLIAESDYDGIAKKVQDFLVQDVINTTLQTAKDNQEALEKPEKNKESFYPVHTIKMSDNASHAMHKLRDINNEQIVDYVVLQEDFETYVPAIRELIQKFGNFILENDLSDKLGNIRDDAEIKKQLKEKYQNTPFYKFVDFLSEMDPKEHEFSQQMVGEAIKQSISDELEIARQIVFRRKRLEDFSEEIFPRKKARISQFVSYYNNNNLVEKMEKNVQTGQSEKKMYVTKRLKDKDGQAQQTVTEEYDEESVQKDIDSIFKQVKNPKKKHRMYVGLTEGIALEMGARYLSTLNDIEFIQTLEDFSLIDEKQRKSLTRPYKDIDLQSEVYRDPNWGKVADSQRKETNLQTNSTR